MASSRLSMAFLLGSLVACRAMTAPGSCWTSGTAWTSWWTKRPGVRSWWCGREGVRAGGRVRQKVEKALNFRTNSGSAGHLLSTLGRAQRPITRIMATGWGGSRWKWLHASCPLVRFTGGSRGSRVSGERVGRLLGTTRSWSYRFRARRCQNLVVWHLQTTARHRSRAAYAVYAPFSTPKISRPPPRCPPWHSHESKTRAGPRFPRW